MDDTARATRAVGWAARVMVFAAAATVHAQGATSPAVSRPFDRRTAPPRDVRVRADSLANSAMRFDGTPDYVRMTAQMRASLAAYQFPDQHMQRTMMVAFAERSGKVDEAFAQLDTLLAEGWIDPENIANFPTENPNILRDARWPAVHARAVRARERTLRALDPQVVGLSGWHTRLRLQALFTDLRIGPRALLDSLARFRAYVQPTARGRWTLHTASVAANGGGSPRRVDVLYFVWIPPTYMASTPTPALIWSHQGWYYRPEPQRWSMLANVRDNPFWRSSLTRDWIQIVPLMWRDLDGSTDIGQGVFREIVRLTKLQLNVDDDRVVFAGHSNGASAAYRAAAESPSSYAAFVPINGWPDPGLAMRNFANRSIWSWSGTRDNVFPSTEVQALHQWATPFAASWTLSVMDGVAHSTGAWIDDELPSMAQRIGRARRTSFDAERVVQSAGAAPVRVDWLGVDQVDPTRPRAPWHQPLLTPTVATSGDGVRGSRAGAVVQDSTSGVVRARYANNEFDVEASRVARFSVYISSAMVDLDKPVVIRVNGEERFRGVVQLDRRAIVARFLEDSDRQQLWAARVPVTVP
jgi:predicted esterase